MALMRPSFHPQLPPCTVDPQRPSRLAPARSRHGNGTALLLEFGLPKASYATVAIREVMKMAKSLGVGDLVGGLRS